MVQLRQTAITDLSIRFARHMGGNKVRHYRVGAVIAHALGLSSGDTFTSAKMSVANYLKEKEGIEEVEFLENTRAPQQGTGVLNIVDASDVVLAGDRGLKKALKRKYEHILVEYNWYKNIFDRVHDEFWHFLHKKFNRSFGFFKGYRYNRNVHVARYLSVACEEGEVEQAVESLRKDLKILQKNKLIVGHLAMPSIIELADHVGIGKKVYAVFCFPIVNVRRAVQLLNANPLDLPAYYLDKFGVKNETPEGSVNYLNGVSPEQKYDIEVISVIPDEDGAFSTEDGRAAVLKTYESSKEWVNEVAKGMAEKLQEYEKESESYTFCEVIITEDGTKRIRPTGVQVNVKMKKKDKPTE